MIASFVRAPYPISLKLVASKPTFRCTTRMTSQDDSSVTRYKTRHDIPMTSTAYGKWIRKETGWTTPDVGIEFLMNKKGLEAVSVWQNDEMVSSGMVVPTHAPLSFTRNENEMIYFVNNVITATQHRRKGLARHVVMELLEMCERRGVTEVRLIPSPAGQPLYESFGFVNEQSWCSELMTNTKTDFNKWKVGRVEQANDEQLEDAIKLEGLAFDRRDLSRIDIQNGMICYVINGDKEGVDAAMWMHSLESEPTTGVVNTWIGPVVARNSDTAKEVVQGGLAHWERMHGVNDVSALVLKYGGGSSEDEGMAKKVFLDLCFETQRDVPIMRKPLKCELNALEKPSRMAIAINDFYGL